MKTEQHKIFGLLLIGDELLSGKRADKHMEKVIDILKDKGQELSWVHCIGDDPVRITQTLQWAASTGDCVFSCGGIGATPDDHTRSCAAQAFGVELELHPEAKKLILERTQDAAIERGGVVDLDSEETRNRLKMGEFPIGAHIIPNPFNKIPGFSFNEMYFFPGFPVMAWPMMEWVLEHYYADLLPLAQKIERSILVYDIGEAALTPLLLEIERRFQGVKVFSLPSVDNPIHGAHIELGLKGQEAMLNSAFEYMLSQLKKMPLRLGAEVG